MRLRRTDVRVGRQLPCPREHIIDSEPLDEDHIRIWYAKPQVTKE